MANMIINTQSGKTDLNGLPISLRGTTAYKDVFFGDVSWNKTCYVALAGLSQEEQEFLGTKTFIWHLSYHDDACEAAYVAMKFNENRLENLKKLINTKTGEWQCEIPEFEYEAIDTEEMKQKRSAIVLNKSVKKSKQKILIDDTPARQGVNTKYGFQVLKELAQKFGRDLVTSRLNVLTTNEFELNFGLSK